MTKRILVVDDEQSIATLLRYNLEQAGYEVETVYDGIAGRDAALDGSFDVILLDRMLPKLEGIEVCKQLRASGVITPILILTAKDDELDKVIGLELGADDYMTKPFSPREVVARVKAMLRRTEMLTNLQKSAKSVNGVLQVGNLRVYPDEYTATINGEVMELTRKEFHLLLYLAKNIGSIVSREQLLHEVWQYAFAGDTRIIDVHISHLRDKIEPDVKNPVYIRTVRGIGYKLEEPKR